MPTANPILTVELLLALMALASVVSLGTLVVWARISPDPDQAIRAMITRASGATVFLFDGPDLIDSTASACVLMQDLATGGTDFARLMRGLSGRFQRLPPPELLIDQVDRLEFQSSDPNDDLCLKLEGWNGFLKVTLTHSGADTLDVTDLDLGHSDELARLRAASDNAPCLMWQLGRDGQVDWANEAYLQKLRDSGSETAEHWPPADLFAAFDISEKITPALKPMGRTVVEGQSYDVSAFEHAGKRQFFAVSAEPTVRAEQARRDFIQTLTKTFAQLSIGLAIFDQNRQLILFNPALMDLFCLPVDFLSRRPSLQAFLDRLREEQMIAEPKNYKAWRGQILELEAKAADGSYSEAWSLPGGVTYRVTGRPHPDGAIAFLFEDISAETSLTQRFRSEIELGYAALDAMEEAVAVISPNGMVALTNKAYRALWHDDPGAALLSKKLGDVLDDWKSLSIPSPVWADLMDAVTSRSAAHRWIGNAALKDGRLLRCRTKPLAGGATLIAFRVSAPLSTAATVLAARRKQVQTGRSSMPQKLTI